MAFVLYEIIEEDSNGRQTLVDTAADLVEAKRIAKAAIKDGAEQVIIFQDTGYDDYVEVERFKKLVDL